MIRLLVCIELPPAKRRRTSLAGSIVSTAVSAALIGTAVGLTVYRLWRDRGKEPEAEHIEPPPAYEMSEWVAPTPVQAQPPKVVPPTPQPTPRKSRQLAVSSKRAAAATRSRRPRTRPHGLSPPPDVSSPRRKFDFGTSDHEDSTEDQMDWIGGKLAMLIEEGKKALGREVVVMSDSKEDEVDDGMGAWEEERVVDDDSKTRRRSGSISQSRIRSGSSPLASWRKDGYSLEPPTPSFMSQSYSPSSSIHSQFSRKEKEEDGISPELKEYMERARARYRNPV